MPSDAIASRVPLAPPVLEYSAARQELPVRSRWGRAIALMAAIPAAVSAFVEYTFSVSPLDVATEFFSRLWEIPDRDVRLLMLVAAPFFLGVVIALRCLRLLISHRETRVERVLHVSLAALSALLTCAFFGFGVYRVIIDDDSLRELMQLAPGPVVLMLGAVLLWWMRTIRAPAGVIPTAALCIAYLANAVICIIQFWRDSDPGWMWALSASIVFTLQLAHLMLQSLRARRAG